MSSTSKRAAWVVAVAVLVLLPRRSAAVPTEPGTLQNALIEPANCQNCHGFQNAVEHQQEPPYAAYYTWRGTMMGNAARDPVFWAAVAIANQDMPGATTECVRCHAPNAFLQGRADAIAMDDLTARDLDGSVECELCHRMVDDADTAPGNAQYTIDDTIVDVDVPRRGPWSYSNQDAPPHEWLQDAYIGTSEICGTCHDVTTPQERVDDQGVGLGMEFNEQRTYTEWLNSAFAAPGEDFRSCQECHMPAVSDVPGCQDNVNVSSHPEGGRRHDLVGANRRMLEILMGVYGSGGTDEINDFFWNLSIQRTAELLHTAATVEVVGPDTVDITEGLDGLSVTVTNETGHKLPSGYSEGRVMWIEVTARYAGDVVFSSGQWDAQSGIQLDDQLRTYEAIADDFADGATFHLLRNNHWVVDSRIPPRGLQPDIETDPVGARYSVQQDGTWPHWDEVAYAFDGRDDVMDATPADATDDLLEVQVRLCYLINTPSYIQFLADENQTNDAGNQVAMLFDTAEPDDPCDDLLAEPVTLSIPIVGFPQVDGTSSSTTGTTADGVTTADGTEVTGDTEPGEPGSGTNGCGCRASSPVSPGIWLVGMALVGWRCRPRSGRAPKTPRCRVNQATVGRSRRGRSPR